jgi:hypothetical protein
MISSFAVWMQLEEAVTIVFPRRTYPFPALSGADPVFVGEHGELEPAVETAAIRIAVAVGEQPDRVVALELIEAGAPDVTNQQYLYRILAGASKRIEGGSITLNTTCLRPRYVGECKE